MKVIVDKELEIMVDRMDSKLEMIRELMAQGKTAHEAKTIVDKLRATQ